MSKVQKEYNKFVQLDYGTKNHRANKNTSINDGIQKGLRFRGDLKHTRFNHVTTVDRPDGAKGA